MLLENGANINVVNKLNNNALTIAISEGMHKHETSLIKRGSFDNDNIFFLGFDKIAEQLIQKGADVHVLGQFGRTALSLAAKMGKN